MESASTVHVNGPNRTDVVTADDVLRFIGFGWFQLLVCSLVCLTYFALGTDVSIFIFVGTEVQKKWSLSDIKYATFFAATAIPNLIGAGVFSVLADQFGRVWPYAISTALMGVFGVASAFAPSYAVLVLLKSMTSLGVGGIRVLSIPYLIEFVPVKNRAKVSILSSLAMAVGLCTASGLAWWLLPTYPVEGWRYFMIAMAVPSIPLTVLRLAFYFESPRFYIARGKFHKAWKVFASMARINGKALTDFVSETDFYNSVLGGKATGGKHRFKSLSLRDLPGIFKPPYRRRTISLAIVLLAAELGYQGSALFLPQFLSKRQGVNIYFTLLTAFAAQIPGFFLMSIIVEWPKVGRLNTLRLFSGMTAVFFVLIAFVQTPVTIPVFVVLIFFTMPPILALAFVYVSESYPTNIRASSTATFYAISTVFAIGWPFVSGYAVGFPQPWVYPLVWAGVYCVQLLAGLVLNYEPYGQGLVDHY